MAIPNHLRHDRDDHGSSADIGSEDDPLAIVRKFARDMGVVEGDGYLVTDYERTPTSRIFGLYRVSDGDRKTVRIENDGPALGTHADKQPDRTP